MLTQADILCSLNYLNTTPYDCMSPSYINWRRHHERKGEVRIKKRKRSLKKEKNEEKDRKREVKRTAKEENEIF
jgi:hypothetical protein